jgi:parvulin-like peptidyl-prolyl isomerase
MSTIRGRLPRAPRRRDGHETATDLGLHHRREIRGEAVMPQDVTTVRTIARRAIAGATFMVGALFVLAAPTGVAFAADEQIVAVVDGEPITAADVEQRTRFDQLAKHREPSRQEVIEELTDEKLKLQHTRKSGIDVADSEVDAAYARMAKRMNLTPEQLTAALAHAGVDATTLRHRIRADIAWRQYVRGAPRPIRPDDAPPPPENNDKPLAAAPDKEIVADAEGQPVTAAEVEQRIKFYAFWAARRIPSPYATDQPWRAPSREGVIEQLRTEKLDMAAARRSRIKIEDRDVEAGYSSFARKVNMTPAELTEALTGSDSHAQTVKHMIRGGLAQQKLAKQAREPKGWQE